MALFLGLRRILCLPIKRGHKYFSLDRWKNKIVASKKESIMKEAKKGGR
jgi:hypothetical protein